MIIERRQISIRGLPVDVVRKAIKNLNLGVYPPHGRVRVAAPLGVSDEAVRLAVIGKLGWIKRHRARFEDQPRKSKREMVSGADCRLPAACIGKFRPPADGLTS